MALIIDVTHTLATGAGTGIQRVVRELVRRLATDRGAVPVAALDDRFHALTRRGREALERPTVNAGASNATDRRRGAALLVMPAVFERLQAWNFNRRIRQALSTLVDPVAYQAKPGDVVLLLDAFWGGSSAPAAADAARRAGARIVPIIYDMIPVSHPAYMEPATVAVFARRVRRALAQATGVVAISNACVADVIAFSGKRPLPVRAFRLGGDFAAKEQERDRGGPARRFVVVGTVEPRKGHALVLDAFERLWAAGEDVELTFVGRVGWADQALLARLRNHPERGRRFVHHPDASDHDLAAVVRAADATIVASVVEGFGLPIVESLMQGVPVIASDIPVFREVGGDTALYFDVGDSAALAAAVRRFRADPAPWRTRAATFTWSDWTTSARELEQAVAAVLDDASAAAR